MPRNLGPYFVFRSKHSSYEYNLTLRTFSGNGSRQVSCSRFEISQVAHHFHLPNKLKTFQCSLKSSAFTKSRKLIIHELLIFDNFFSFSCFRISIPAASNFNYFFLFLEESESSFRNNFLSS